MSALPWLVERLPVLGSRVISNFRLLLGREGFYIASATTKGGLEEQTYLEKVVDTCHSAESIEVCKQSA